MRALLPLAALFVLHLDAQPVIDAGAQARFPEPRRMLRSHLTRLALGQLEQRSQAVSAIRTPEQFERRRQEFRKQLLAMIGGLPDVRPPLELRRSGRLDRGSYRVEKIVFQSQPNFHVTANLYVPQTGAGPFPAVLHSIGHTQSAKNHAFYQTLSIGLVKHGFVVLAYDPLGQGERVIYYDPDLEGSKVGRPTSEHEMAGIQSLLAGESLARLMIWDGVRGIDLLASLPEVDPKRIGITGCSGGGTLTTYLAAVDPRVAVAAPACYITSWVDQLQTDTGPQDAEQQFPDLLRLGYDHADYVTAFAPKPYLICSTDQDFFPLSGARRTFEEAARMYGILGARERVEWFHEPGGHGMPKATREAVYGWMRHWLAGAPRGPAEEPEIRVEHEEDLNATETGQLATSLGGETASTLIRARLAARLAAPPARSGLRERVAGLTRYQAPVAPAKVHTLGRVERAEYMLERMVIEQANGRFLPALLAVPRGGPRRRAVFFAGGQGAAAAFAAGGDLDALACAGHPVLAADLSGRGETASNWRSYSESWFGQEKETWLALMTGRTLVGLRAEDVAAAVPVLGARGLAGGEGVTGFGKGPAAIDLLHAAVLGPARFARLLLEDMLVSWAAAARSPLHRGLFESLAPGVIGAYDLPDLALALAPTPVALVNARSPLGNPVLSSRVREEYSRASGTVRVGVRRQAETVLEAYPELR